MPDQRRPARPPLPVDELLPDLVEQLERRPAAVLTAPPGAGKTTRVPLALLDGPGEAGLILLLQPRRIAARAVARMMARSLGERAGQTVGYRVRFDERRSRETRVLVVTEGILGRMLIADPLLEGVSCVILDEFHERSVHLDLALAFLKEVQEARDLKIVVMSATLDAAPIRDYLGDCAALSCEGRQHPLRVDHLTAPPDLPLAKKIRSALVQLMRREDDDGGDVLVFLPGVPEISRCLRLLEQEPLPGDPELTPLHGSLPAAAQDRALRRAGGRRRVVLSTNIAETSLTVPGVTAVVDSGLVKQPRYDTRIGLDRLELTMLSRFSATQRAGRAGRTAPGRVLRLWPEAEHPRLATGALPELHRLDLAPALLQVLAFHPGDPFQFDFFDRPPREKLEAALDLLQRVGAVETGHHRLTRTGHALVRLPLHPRVGVMLLRARDLKLLEDGALLAALLGEREILRRSGKEPTTLPSSRSDLLTRRDLVLELEEQGASERSARRLGINLPAAREVIRARSQLMSLIGRKEATAPRARASWRDVDEGRLLELILSGYPDRVCRRRRPRQPQAIMVGGRGVKLADESGVRDDELFVALSADAGRRGLHAVSLVRTASAVDEAMLTRLFPGLVRREETTRFDEQRRAVVGLRRRLFADLLLGEREDSAVIDEEQGAALLATAAITRLEHVFQPDKKALQLIARLELAARFMPGTSWPAVDRAGIEALITLRCRGARTLEQLESVDWAAELSARLDFQQRRLLDEQLPPRWMAPSGRTAPIDYEPCREGKQPVLAIKLQELFGLGQTPRVAMDRLPLLLHLLAPSGRPVQVTQDLESFWNGTYAEVRKDLRGRYPRHPWPEDPWSARPTAHTRRRRR